MKKQLIAILLSDFYKQCHPSQYDKRITKLVNYYTPRSTRIEDWKEVPVIGIQKWIKEYLIDNFNENFFNVDLIDVINQYGYIIDETLGKEHVNSDRIAQLWKLGYLPLDIRALEEGTMCPIGCPMIEVSNTHDDFAWLVNNIETIELSELWYPMVTACVGIEYRNIANEYYQLTSDNSELARHAFSDFGFRSLIGMEGACKASLGFLLSFDKTATIPAIWNIHQNYGDPIGSIAKGMASTEHSVMCSSFAIDGDEITQVRRLLTEIYPIGNFSMVSDSYDYWNLVENILPQLKKEILNREGTLYIRGDSGDPVEIVTDTVFKLWDIFGGTVNSKGYKVLDSHIRAIYGDGITPARSKAIFKNLEKRGFSAENVALGIGGFSLLARQEWYTVPEYNYKGDKRMVDSYYLNPFNRDTFGVAIKTTWGEYKTLSPSIESDGICTSDLVETKIGFDIFKDPKTDTDKLKKSQKGCCIVFNTKEDIIIHIDGRTIESAHSHRDNILKPLFLNGRLLRETTFNEIRNRLWNNKF